MHTLRRLGLKFPTMVLAVIGLWTVIWVDARGQSAAPPKDSPIRAEGYILPPKIILDAIPGAHPEERLLYTNICPDGKKFLVTRGAGMPSVEQMARPAVHLGDTAFDHSANRAHGLYVRSNAGYDLFFYADKRTVPVELPPKTRVSNPVWSPDGSQLAFFGHSYDATHIYVADTASGKSRKITPVPVQATLVTNFQWTGDGKRIQAVLAPDDGTRRFPFNEASVGPMVRVTEAKKEASRTIRYLMETPHDMQLLEHLITAQLAVVDVASGKITNVGKPGLLKSVNASPGADSFRVATMKKASFSYSKTFSSFGSSEGIWNAEGKTVYTFAGAKGGKGKKADDPVDPDPDKQKKDAEPKDDPEGKRDLGWRPDGVGMTYLMLEPAKKDAKDSKEPRKDRVMQWLPPWNNTSVKIVYESPNPITSVQYNDDCTMMFLTVTADKQRQIVAVDLKDPKNPTWVVYKGAAPGEPDPVFDSPDSSADDTPVDPYDFFARSMDDEQKGKGGDKGGGGAPGGGLMTRARGSAKVVRISSTEDVYVSGNEKNRPIIDRINIKTGKKSRVFTGKGEMVESIDAVNGDDITVVFTNGQKRTVPPNTYMYDLKSGSVEKLTNNVDHTPWFHDLKSERVQITREDGFKFWAKVTTSPNVKKKAPAMFWFYPKEFTDQAAYDKKSGGGGKAAGGGAGKGGKQNDMAKYTQPGTRSMSILTILGYAVVEPDCPIVGPKGKMNDNYVKDLKSSLKATVDELAKLEFIDPDRLALGGHSYGAFSTANAMCHTTLFKAGIAGDGCYNRTLTPMSFQTEQRHIWNAMDTYLAMSPFLHADKMSGALLMYHGAWDRNVGTHPINSERMFAALKGLGKPCALYMYPYEDHGPIGKETQLDMWARWVPWLDMYVMNPQVAKKK